MTQDLDQIIKIKYAAKEYIDIIAYASSLKNHTIVLKGTLGCSYYKINELRSAKDILSEVIQEDPKACAKLWYRYLIDIYIRNKQQDLIWNLYKIARKHEKIDDKILELMIKYIDQNKISKSEVGVAKDVINVLTTTYPYKLKKIVASVCNKILESDSIRVHNEASNCDLAGKIEIIIPTYNRSDIICDSLGIMQSAQKNKSHKQIINIRILDNCSSDSTVVQIKNRFQDKNIILGSNEKNMGITYSTVKLFKQATSEYVIFTSDEDPILLDELPALYEFLAESNADFVSPMFFADDKIYRGLPCRSQILPEHYLGSSFYFSGLVLRTSFVKKHLSWIEPHLFKEGQVYPLVLIAMTALAIGKAFWYDRPISYRAHLIKSVVHNETSTGRFNNVYERWRQFEYSCAFIDDLFNLVRLDDHIDSIDRVDRMRRSSYRAIGKNIFNSMVKRYPELNDYFEFSLKN